MSLWTRLRNTFRNEGLQREIDEAIAQGRDPDEARRAFGSSLRYRESSREARLITWLDSSVPTPFSVYASSGKAKSRPPPQFRKVG